MARARSGRWIGHEDDSALDTDTDTDESVLSDTDDSNSNGSGGSSGDSNGSESEPEPVGTPDGPVIQPEEDTQSSSNESDNKDPKALDHEKRLRLALDLIRNSPLSPKTSTGHTMSVRAAAAKTGCAKSTLAKRWNGRTTRALAHGTQQKVAPAMEKVLVEWIVELGRRGLPTGRALVIEKAEAISGVTLGEQWYHRFMRRHRDTLASRWTRSLETARAKGLNKPATVDFMKQREQLQKEYNIQPEHDYNLDEKGIMNGQGDKARVLVHKQQRHTYKIHSGGRQLSTVIECFSASGKALVPTLIHKGERMRKSWFNDNPGLFRYVSRGSIKIPAALPVTGLLTYPHLSIMHSPKGWTDKKALRQYLEECFEPQTRIGLQPGQHRMLTLDGHNSHISLAVVSFCEANNIILMNLPPHTTHALQPCDVGIFGPLAAAWRKVVGKYTRYGLHIEPEDIPALLHQARQKSITPEIIKSAWAQSGLHPLRLDAIPAEMFEPSKLSTRKAAQPIPTTLPPFLVELRARRAAESTVAPAAAAADEGSATGDVLPAQVPEKTTSTDDTIQDTIRSELSAARATSDELQFAIRDFPSPISIDATRRDIVAQNAELRRLLHRSLEQHQRDHALKVLMDEENGILRVQLNRRRKKTSGEKFSANIRHLTHSAAIEQIARDEWARKFRVLWSDGRRRKKWVKAPDYEEAAKKAAIQEGQQQRAAARAVRGEERRGKEEERQRKAEQREIEKRRKVEEKEVERRRKEEEKVRKAEEREAERQRKAARGKKKATATATATATASTTEIRDDVSSSALSCQLNFADVTDS